MTDKKQYDVIIIGGSYAGLSAAMSLGRSLRNVLIIDNNKPCNRQTPHSHNFLMHDGETPSLLSNKAKEQVLNYDSIVFHDGLVVKGSKVPKGFEVETQAGAIFKSKKLLFASGIKDLLPDIPGFAKCWGISVLHCPYCHGYENRNKKTALLSNGDMAFEFSKLLRNLTPHLSILTNGPSQFTPEQSEILNRNGIQIYAQEIARFSNQEGKLTKIVFKDGSQEEFTVAYAKVNFTQHCTIPQELGCELDDHGYLKTDVFQQTTVHGVYACGDNTSPKRAVSAAIASGNFAGAAINKELADEDFAN